MFFFIFLKKCNIVNIEIICFLLAHFNSVFNNYLFFKFINKCQKKILRCVPPSSHVWDFCVMLLYWNEDSTFWKNELKGVHGRYIENKYTFLHKVVYKWALFTHSYLMVSVWTVKDARCKTKIWYALMSQKGSVQA